MLAQDARSFLPFNVKTKTMHTLTLTNFLHFIAVRTGKAAQPEVRLIAKEMVKVYKEALDRMVDEVDPEYAELALDICNRIKDYIDSISSKDKMVIYYNNEKVEV
jgi:thymidylate synthase ThyX